MGVHPFLLFASNNVSFSVCALLITNLCIAMMCFTEMDLFAVVKLEKPKQVTVGVRPLGRVSNHSWMRLLGI